MAPSGGCPGLQVTIYSYSSPGIPTAPSGGCPGLQVTRYSYSSKFGVDAGIIVFFYIMMYFLYNPVCYLICFLYSLYIIIYYLMLSYIVIYFSYYPMYYPIDAFHRLRVHS